MEIKLIETPQLWYNLSQIRFQQTPTVYYSSALLH